MQKLHVLESIGNTPIVELRRLVPDGHARIFAKVEGQNPTGSMKDRMALSVVDRAAESGRLVPSGTVVEYTGGSTGTSLAFVCAARGYPITVVTSDAFSKEKWVFADSTQRVGEVTQTPSTTTQSLGDTRMYYFKRSPITDGLRRFLREMLELLPTETTEKYSRRRRRPRRFGKR